MESLQTDLVAELAPLHNIPGFDREKAVLDQLANLKWDESRHRDYISMQQRAAPHITRDSRAAAKGFKVPAYIHYEAIAYSALGNARDANRLWKSARQLLRQMQTHEMASTSATSSNRDTLVTVFTICERFHMVAKQLESRREGRTTLTIQDEYNVQDLLHALLKLHFEDVQPEENILSFAGRTARMDFLLNSEQIVVETKMTRSNLKDKEIGGTVLPFC